MFLPGGPSQLGEIEHEPLYCSIDGMLMLAVLALEANRIGPVATGSTHLAGSSERSTP